jgi:hypothetical protein
MELLLVAAHLPSIPEIFECKAVPSSIRKALSCIRPPLVLFDGPGKHNAVVRTQAVVSDVPSTFLATFSIQKT